LTRGRLGQDAFDLYGTFTRLTVFFTVFLLGDAYREGITSLQEVTMVERKAWIVPRAFL
jgi:hypothetical protein